jgi:predicted permease
MRLHPMEVWIPFVALNEITNAPADELHDRAYTMLRIVGRRAPGATVADVRRDLGAISQRLSAAYPEDEHRDIRVFEGTGMTDGERADVKRTPRLLSIAMAMLLLIACANVAGLTLVRAAAKRRELATRVALGASRASLVRQLAIEAGIIAALSGFVGIAIAQVLVRTAAIMQTVAPVRKLQPALDWPTLAVAFAMTATVALLVAMLPAVQVSRTDISILMKDGAGGAIRSRSRAQRLLVVTQVAASLIMLASASVLFGAFRRTLHIDPGFDTVGLKWVSVSVPNTHFDTAEARRFVDDVVSRARSDARIGPIALTSAAPPAPWLQLSRVFRGEDTPSRESLNDPKFTDGSRAYVDAISTDLFKVLRVPMLVGRDFTAEEVRTRAPVAIVTRRLADELWPHENPLGRMISWPTTRGPARPPMRVVGVAADIHHSTHAGGPSPVLYVPDAMRLRSSPLLLYRDHGGMQSNALRGVLASVQADLEVDDLVSTNLVDDDLARQRVVSAWIGVFGVIALFLAAIGVYGIIAQSVYQRTRELAVRAAVGARPIDLLRLILNDGVRLGLAGGVIGTMGVVATFRVLRAMFADMQTVDLSAAGIAIVALALAMLLASFIPARRAAALNPVDALRSD